MSYLDAVKAGVRTVLSAGMLAETWQFKRRTSDYATEPPTFGTAGSMSALFVAGGTAEVHDAERGEFKLANVGRLRMADNAIVPSLNIGDRVIAPDSDEWAVVSVQSEAPGSIAFGIARVQGLRGEPARGDGV